MAAYGKRNALIVDGKALSEARVASRVSLQEVATRLQTGKGSVSKWELGKLTPSEERIRRMVEMFGTNSFVRVNPNYRPSRKRKEIA